MKRLIAFLTAVLLIVSLPGCFARKLPDPAPSPGNASTQSPQEEGPSESGDSALSPDDTPSSNADGQEGEEDSVPESPAPPDEAGFFYDLENVVLYLEAYGHLPPNYITKKEAQNLGWQGGSVERCQKGAAIGGDFFGNREDSLPAVKGRRYTECDIDTEGAKNRGSKRLVFSNDGHYYYTDDHYASFTEVAVENGVVVWK
jgi:hypothetical protein